MLTTAAVARARPRAAAYKLADGRGLHLYVAPAPSCLRSWRWRFTWGGKDQTLTIGAYPEISLDQARAAADLARARLARGEDPRVAASSDAAMPADFQAAARAWLAHRSKDWTPVHAAGVLAIFERDVYPTLGALPLAAIGKPDVLAALAPLEQRARKTAHKLKHWLICVFDYAEAKGWTTSNPARGVGQAMSKASAVEHHPALEDIVELRALLAAAAQVRAGPGPQLALRLLALTGVRFACVRFATWAEIEDLDGPEPMWRVPAAHMKLEAAKKLEVVNDHLIPLSPAAVAVLKDCAELYTSAGRANIPGEPLQMEGLIFTGRGGVAPIGENALRDLHVRAGYAGRHVTHGWRASFSTILNEALPDQRGAIDRALGHAGGGKDEKAEGINRQVEGAYNRSKHLGPRRRLFEAWGEMLVPAGAGRDGRD